ncbi:MAG: transposase [Gammaproteobacteria bacterium]
MSQGEHRRFTADQKLAILREAEQPGVTVSAVCRRHGLAPSVFYRWRADSDNDYGGNYLQAEATIAKLMQHYNEQRLHAALGYMTPVTWHRGDPQQLREERARRIAAARAHRKTINQQRFNQAA